jgi:hypothetical protein
MAVIKFSADIVDKYPSVFDYIQGNYAAKIVTYCINSDYRKAVWVSGWLKPQITTPTKEVVKAAELCLGITHDDTVANALRFVKKSIKYTPDQLKWKMPEYWQTASETLSLKTGDCEDGAVLAYVICRLCGVPASRLLLMCGYVEDPDSIDDMGHCWLAYRPSLFPLNWTFMDWCYYPNTNNMEQRSKFYLHVKNIMEYRASGEGYQIEASLYHSLWFAFNEERSYTELKNVGASL